MFTLLLSFHVVFAIVIQDIVSKHYLMITEIQNEPIILTSDVTRASRFKIEEVTNTMADIVLIDEKTSFLLTRRLNSPDIVGYRPTNLPNQFFKLVLDAQGSFQIKSGENEWLYYNESRKTLQGMPYMIEVPVGYILFHDDGETLFPCGKVAATNGLEALLGENDQDGSFRTSPGEEEGNPKKGDSFEQGILDNLRKGRHNPLSNNNAEHHKGGGRHHENDRNESQPKVKIVHPSIRENPIEKEPVRSRHHPPGTRGSSFGV